MTFGNYVFIILLAATCLMLFISYLSFRKRQLPIAKYSALVMLSASFYSFGYAFEIISSDLNSIKFWLKIEYIGIPFISTFWFILVIYFTGHTAVLRKWIMLLFVIPIMTLIMHYTNDLHHFYYSDMRIDTNSPFQVKAVLDKGPWYWVHMAYNYAQAVAGMILFVLMYLKSMPIVRKQILILMLGAAAPWLFNVIYLFGWDGLDLDMTSFGFTLSGLFYLWGIYRFNLLRLVPIALQKVFETMEDGVLILDCDNTIMNVNRAGREIFHLVQPLNRSANSVFADYPELMSIISKQENSANRITIKRQEEIRFYTIKLSLLFDKDQTMLGKMLIFSDITQVTNYQNRLLSHAKQLEEFSAFKDKLFTVIAHDIRDPLAMLVNLTELLGEDLEGAGSGDLSIFQEVSGQVRNTYMLVEHLIDWFRSQKGEILFSPLEWKLASIVEHTLDYVKSRSVRKRIQLITNIDTDLSVIADKEMLELVLRNLLSNAVKFTGRNGCIRVGATQDGEWVTVSVQDSGVGVDEEIAQTLFHEVQQATASGTEEETGSGLGLYLTEKFVSVHGGQIWFESIHGQGSTFFFTLRQADGIKKI